MKTDAKLCQCCCLGRHPGGLPTILPRLTPSLEWISVASAFSPFLINVFKTEKKSERDLVTKIHFQFWQPLLQDRQRLLVLSLGLQVLEEKHKVDMSQLTTLNQ